MRLFHTKHLMVMVIVAAATVAAFAQEKKGGKRAEHKAVNLKVLPKDISTDSLINTMHYWESALGVNCGYCHAPSKTEAGRLDFASDENHRKDISRHMYNMADSINHQYFSWWNPAKESHPVAVTCYTCHHGQAQPEAWMPAPEKK